MVGICLTNYNLNSAIIGVIVCILLAFINIFFFAF